MNFDNFFLLAQDKWNKERTHTKNSIRRRFSLFFFFFLFICLNSNEVQEADANKEQHSIHLITGYTKANT